MARGHPNVINNSAAQTIAELRQLFAAHGLPRHLVSDNGPQFVAEEFATFCKMSGVKHIRCAPYYPSSNDLAERFVQTFKRALTVSQNDEKPFNQRLSNFLLGYRCTPHATTNRAPCELFMGRRLQTRLDLLRPHLREQVENKEAQQKREHDQQKREHDQQKREHDCHARDRQLEPGQEAVTARNFRPGADWVPAIVIRQLAPLTYLVEVKSQQCWKRHIDHLRCYTQPEERSGQEHDEDQDYYPPSGM